MITNKINYDKYIYSQGILHKQTLPFLVHAKMCPANLFDPLL